MAAEAAEVSKKMLCGKPAKSTSREASTVAHIVIYKLMQARTPELEQINFQFKDALSYIEDDPGSDTILFVDLHIHIHDLLAGNFDLNVNGDRAANVIEALPATVSEHKVRLRVTGAQSNVDDVLEELKERQKTREDRSTSAFIISCNALKFWFAKGYATFKPRPTNTFLNQNDSNKVILGQALSNVLACLQRMTLLALTRFGNSDHRTMLRVNDDISSDVAYVEEMANEEDDGGENGGNQRIAVNVNARENLGADNQETERMEVEEVGRNAGAVAEIPADERIFPGHDAGVFLDGAQQNSWLIS